MLISINNTVTIIIIIIIDIIVLKPAKYLLFTWLLADFKVQYIRLRMKQEILDLNLHLLQISDLSIVSYLFEDLTLANSAI